MTVSYIYGLCDPKSQQLRYIGKTNNPTRREREHHLRDDGRSYLSCWIKSLKKQGLLPEFLIIEEVDKSAWQESERFWISYFRSIGADLVNGSHGGLGGSKKGHKFSPEGRAKINAAVSKSCKGKPLNEEHKAKLRAAKLGKRQSEETRQKRSVLMRGINNPNFGKPMSEEQKKKISVAKTGKPGKPHTEKTKRRIAEAQRGRIFNEETKRKMSEGQRNRAPFSEGHRKKLSEAIKLVWQKRKAIQQD